MSHRFPAAVRDVVPCPRCERDVRVAFATDGMGRVIERMELCGWCERKRAGRCQRCHVQRVDGAIGQALHCAPCRVVHRRERQRERARKRQNPWKHAGICMDCKEAPVYGKVGWAETCEACRDERIRATARRSYQSDPAKREARNAYKREWRRKNRDKVRMQKRRAALRRGGETPESIVRWREEVEAGIRAPERARRNLRGERLCLTPGCHTVMRGRAKKCEPCKSGHLPEEVRDAA